MNSLRRITDIVLFFSFCFLAGSGIMMKFSFIKGMGPQYVFGLMKPEWCQLHLWAGAIMLLAVVIHLFLNRLWIEKIAAMNKRWLAVLVIALGVAMALTLALWPTEYVNSASSDDNGTLQGGHGMGYGWANGPDNGRGRL